MAEENENTSKNEFPTDAPDTVALPDAKKQRASRRSKAEIEASTSAASAKKVSPLKGRKKVAKPSTGAVAAATAKAERKTAASVKQPSIKAPIAGGDEFADLIQLEEENKKLRRELSEKLRAENADLRKKLGQD